MPVIQPGAFIGRTLRHKTEQVVDRAFQPNSWRIPQSHAGKMALWTGKADDAQVRSLQQQRHVNHVVIAPQA